MDIIQYIAKELAVRPQQVQATVQLLDEGSTVPFIARYRKETTGGLDDSQLRTLQERLGYLRELNERRAVILNSIREQGKLTPELESTIANADTKTLLEDLYLPYKPKRRTKAQIAREAGLEPLADQIFEDRTINPSLIALNFINVEQGISTIEEALEGARHIIMERLAENADLLSKLREHIWNNGILKATALPGKEQEGSKFKDYFDYQEVIHKIPSHRALALLRGRNEDILGLTLIPEQDEQLGNEHCLANVFQSLAIKDISKPADAWLAGVARQTWKIKLFTRLDLDLKLRLREHAELEAIHVFANNLRDLLLAAPAGLKTTMGLDPGIRTGVKVAVVDPTGKLLATETIYPHAPKNQWQESIHTLAKLIRQHHVDLVSVGNGTASRETEQLVDDLMQQCNDLKITKVLVSEAGASVYSASELATKEFPNLDVSLRGAVSIARRLQDPLAELVKIDPKSIGVGQYQHDINQSQLARSLERVVEDCVNAVGVDVNTASPALLKQVSGLSSALSENIVAYRNEHGAFTDRSQLKKVPRLGEKAYEQAAGFLRIIKGSNPLDASAVHPEAYPVVEAILKATGKSIRDLIGQSQILRKIDPKDYANEQFGLPTVNDILKELEKPGRDPRPEFKSVQFKAGVKKITDLQRGMRLNGVITNVANFGAFVDIGVHQDGLIHISHLSDNFVKDPRTAVKTGDLVSVRVVEVDIARNRIALSLKSENTSDNLNSSTSTQNPKSSKVLKPSRAIKSDSSIALAFAKATNKSSR